MPEAYSGSAFHLASSHSPIAYIRRLLIRSDTTDEPSSRPGDGLVLSISTIVAICIGISVLASCIALLAYCCARREYTKMPRTDDLGLPNYRKTQQQPSVEPPIEVVKLGKELDTSTICTEMADKYPPNTRGQMFDKPLPTPRRSQQVEELEYSTKESKGHQQQRREEDFGPVTKAPRERRTGKIFPRTTSVYMMPPYPEADRQDLRLTQSHTDLSKIHELPAEPPARTEGRRNWGTARMASDDFNRISFDSLLALIEPAPHGRPRKGQ